MSRKYWSQRHARDSELPLAVASRLFASVVESLQQRGYFTEWFGFHCVDLDFVSGLAGADAAAYAMRKTYRDDVWPVSINHSGWDEDAFLTAVEFAYDHVSKPVGGSYHSWNQCGDHWDKFDRDAGQEEYRNEVNDLLRDYGFGFELRSDGHVVRLAPSGLEPLLEAQPPMLRGVAYEGRVAAAVSKFRRRESSA